MAVAVGDQRRRKEAMEALIADITKGSDQSLFPSIRSALERGWAITFVDALAEAKSKKEAEIDRLCARHYGGFLTSVQELLTMKGSAVTLQKKVTKSHEDFNSIGHNLMTQLSSLEVLEQELENTRRIQDAIHQCKEIAQLMVQAQEQLDSDDHYAALLTIDKLQHEQHTVSVQPFLKSLQVWLPNSINRLLEASRKEVNAWISNSKEKNSVLGMTLLHKYAQLSIGSAGQNNSKDDEKRKVYASSNGRGNNVYNSIETTDVAVSSFHMTPAEFLSSTVEKIGGVSISLLYILRNAKVFRMQTWMHIEDVDRIVPLYFLDPPSEEGIKLLDVLPEQLDAIHKALHIYSSLGELASLYEHFSVMRGPAIDNMFLDSHKQAAKHGLIAALPNLVSDICGFFVTECVCRQCLNHRHHSDGYFSWSQLNLMWDDACKSLEEFCIKHVQSVVTPDDALLAKEYLLLLQETLSDPAFGLRPNYFQNILGVLWNRFELLQVDFINRACLLALDNCAYQPITVTSEDRLEQQVKAYRLDAVRLDEDVIGEFDTTDQKTRRPTLHHSMISAAIATGNAGASPVPVASSNAVRRLSAADMLDALEENFDVRSAESSHNSTVNGIAGRNQKRQFIPLTFPFSEAVPVVLRELHVMIVRFYLFSVRIKNVKNVGEAVCRSVVKAFAAFSQNMLKKLLADGAETPLSKACQISIDAATLSHCVMSYLRAYLNSTLSHFKCNDAIDNHLPDCLTLSRKELLDVSNHAQDMVFEILALKVDDLLGSLVFIEWEPQAFPNMAHEQIDEVIDYLRATFMWLTHLPLAAREAAHFTCCSKVTSGIIDHLESPTVSRLNILSIVALDFDVKRLQSFADSCGIKQLRQCFTELAELVRCLLHPDLVQFGENSHLRKTLFPQVDPGRLARIIEKVRFCCLYTYHV